jgi:hypothetical protein
MQMVFYYQMIYFPETDNTVSTIPVMVSNMTTIIQRTTTLTLCINVAWCCDEPASCVLAHPVTSIENKEAAKVVLLRHLYIYLCKGTPTFQVVCV